MAFIIPCNCPHWVRQTSVHSVWHIAWHRRARRTEHWLCVYIHFHIRPLILIMCCLYVCKIESLQRYRATSCQSDISSSWTQSDSVTCSELKTDIHVQHGGYVSVCVSWLIRRMKKRKDSSDSQGFCGGARRDPRRNRDQIQEGFLITFRNIVRYSTVCWVSQRIIQYKYRHVSGTDIYECLQFVSGPHKIRKQWI